MRSEGYVDDMSLQSVVMEEKESNEISRDLVGGKNKKDSYKTASPLEKNNIAETSFEDVPYQKKSK